MNKGVRLLKNLSFLLFFTLSQIVFAQRYEIGAFGGISILRGDLSYEILDELKKPTTAFGGILRYRINDQVAIRGSLFNIKLAGTDANSKDPQRQARNYAFKSNVQEITLCAEISPFAQYPFRGSGEFRSSLNVYGFGGIGLTIRNSDPSPRPPFPEAGDKKNFICIPLGMGIRYQMNEYWSIAGEGGARTVFSDYLDGVAKIGNENNPDYYGFICIGMNYSIGGFDPRIFGNKRKRFF